MKTILLFGGNSEERLVSVASAQNLIKHYEFDQLWFWSEQGFVYLESKSILENFKNPFSATYQPQGDLLSTQMIGSLELVPLAQGAIVFLALHGGSAENGELQTYFESHGIAFTGSRAQASQLAFDKHLSKEKVQQRGGRVAQGLSLNWVTDGQAPEKLKKFWSQHSAIVLKPQASGSSHGLFFVETASELEEFLAKTPQLPALYLAEEWVRGRECTVGCLERFDHQLQELPASEVILESQHHFDYESKYLGKGVLEVTPANLTPGQMQAAQLLARLAHQSVGAFGYSRTDMILTAQGEWVFLEINTLPGLSGASFIPQQLQAAQISLSAFIQEQLNLSSGEVKEIKLSI